MRRSRLVFIVALVLCIVCTVGVHRPASAQAQTHVVQPGETLFHIALSYGVTVEAMIAANNLSDPSHITVGQVLIIPGTGAAVSIVQPPVISAAPVYYVVQPGDTLNSIARAYGVSLQAIMTANNVLNVNHIEVGQRLVIPGSAAPGTGATIPQQPVVSQPAPPTAVPPTAVPPTAVPPTNSAPTVAPPVINPVVSTAKLRTHIVAPGQGLAEIARLYNVTWPAIAALNNITDPNTIIAGTVLKIPDSDMNPITTMENSQGVPPGPLGGEGLGKSITVVLHEQRVYAYQDGQLVRNVLVSTGLPGTPTVTGTYHIYVKYSAQLMTGPGYYLPGVPWVMYFYQGYSFHGAYWHHNWGHPMSHGCVNMPIDEALWLYQWAEVGTPVTVVW